ncbi:MAG: hypothetical protein IJO06_06070 [Thermoguttaceae bacterium]|nr:hypothetical protein [Thermoguttaceae bacterium]
MQTIKSVKTLDAAAATVNLASLDFDGNLNAIAAVLAQLDAQAEERGPVDLRVVVFPELCSTGPGAEDAFLRPAVLKRALAATLAAAKSVGPDVVATVGLPLAFEGAVYKATAVLRDGAVRGFVCASTLAKPSEARQFATWPAGKVAELNIEGRAVPVGDLAFVEAGTSFAVRTLAELATEAGERLDPFAAPETLDEKTLYSAFTEREISEDEEDAAFWESLAVESGDEKAPIAEDAEDGGFAQDLRDGENSGFAQDLATGEGGASAQDLRDGENGEFAQNLAIDKSGEFTQDLQNDENSKFAQDLAAGENGEVEEDLADAEDEGNAEVADGETLRPLDRPTSTARLVVEGVLIDATLGSGRVDAVLCPSATAFAIGRRERIERVLTKISRRDRNLVVYSTPVGVESGAAIFDGGSALALDGDVRTAARFPFVAATFAVNRVELAKTFRFLAAKTNERAQIAQNPQDAQSVQSAKSKEVGRDESENQNAELAEIVEIAQMMQDAEIAQTLNFDVLDLFELARLAEINADAEVALAEGDVLTLTSEVCVDWGDEAFCELEEGLEGWELDADAPFEEFARATALGLFDYMRKSRSRGFALSLSGGADSATIAALIRFGVKLGRRQLGTRLFLRWLTRYFSANGSLDAFPALAAIDAELGEIADAFENGDASRLAVFLAHSDDAFEPALHSALESVLHSSVEEALQRAGEPAQEVYFGDSPLPSDFSQSAENPQTRQNAEAEEAEEEVVAFEKVEGDERTQNEEDGQDAGNTTSQNDAICPKNENENDVLGELEESDVAEKLGKLDGTDKIGELGGLAKESDGGDCEPSEVGESDLELDALFETLLSGGEPSASATSCELWAALEDALERRIVEPLLTTVYQATRNSGDVTRTAAREVAEFCGATHLEFDVDGIVEAYKTLVADATGAPLTWATDDLALQNIQARSRGPSVWLLANRSGRLLLSTGNRSEVACGYATMDGDTCGGLSPIAGIDKAFVRKWLIWAEKTGVLLDFDDQGNEIRFKAPALSFINDQQPTAELRPVEAKQTDEADLMPYTVLNLFERALIRDRLELDAAISRVRTEAAEAGIVVDDETLTGWGVRFARLWARTQWKRQRYAPGFPIDDYDLSPNSWTRYPILSEGFEREIADLRRR